VVHYDLKIQALEKSYNDLLAKQADFINTVDYHQQELDRQQRLKPGLKQGIIKSTMLSSA
jgi:hypothetical protein